MTKVFWECHSMWQWQVKGHFWQCFVWAKYRYPYMKSVAILCVYFLKALLIVDTPVWDALVW